MRIVINRRHGGFGLSRAAFLRLRELGCAAALAEPDFGEFYSDGSGPRSRMSETFGDGVERNDPLLVQEMSDAANGEHASLEIIEVPDDVAWQVEEYDGFEHIAEKHRTWP